MIIPQNKNVCHLIWHLYVDTTVEGSELYCCNAEGDRNSVASQALWRMGWTLLELQAETGIEKRTFHKVLRKDLHLCKIASKWVPHALTKMDMIRSVSFTFLFSKIHIIHTYFCISS